MKSPVAPPLRQPGGISRSVLPVVLGFWLFLGIVMRVHALPGINSARTTVPTRSGVSYTLIRDADDPLQWYYMPHQLRLTRMENGWPNLRIITYVFEGKEHAIFQAQITGGATTDDLKALEAKAQELSEGRKARVTSVGPIRGSKIRIVLLQGSGSNFSLTPLWDKSLDEAVLETTAGKVTSPTNGASASGACIPAGGFLEQATWIEFETHGIGVPIYETMAKGKTGGILVLLDGDYDVITEPADVTVTLDRKKSVQYLMESTSNRRSTTLGFWQKNKSDVQQTVRDLEHENNSLVIRGTQNGQVLTEKQWDAITDRLVDFVTKEVCVPDPKGSLNVPETVGIVPAFMDVGSLLSQFKLELGGVASFSLTKTERTVKYSFNQTVVSSNSATWMQRFVKPQRAVIYGAIGLGDYDDEKRKEIADNIVTQVKIDTLPTVSLRLPFSGANVGYKMGATVKLNLTPDSKQKHEAVFQLQDDQWKIVGDGDPGSGNANVRIFKVRTEEAWSITNAFASLYVNALNPALPSNTRREVGRNNKEAEMSFYGGTNSVIDLGGSRLPINCLTVDLSPLPWDQAISKAVVSFGCSGGDFFENRCLTNPVVFDPFISEKNAPKTASLFYGGQITELAVEYLFDDSFLEGSRRTILWKADKDSDFASRLNVDNVTFTPDDLGLRTYAWDLGPLFKECSTSTTKATELTVQTKAQRAVIARTVGSNGFVSLKRRPDEGSQVFERSVSVELDKPVLISTTQGILTSLVLTVHFDGGAEAKEIRMKAKTIEQANNASARDNFRLHADMFESVAQTK